MPPPLREPLLFQLQRLIERTYRMTTGVTEIGRFVIGDEGYRRFYGEGAAGGRATQQRQGRDALVAGSGIGAGHAGPSARVLVHDGPGPIAAHIYYPDFLIRTLEERPPMRGLHEGNIDPFAIFVEELDHFLLVAERAGLRREVSLLELELHANVTKYLVCALFAGTGAGTRARGALSDEKRRWLVWHLFEKGTFADPQLDVRRRYEDAARYAVRFLSRLESETSPIRRLALLRAFHNASARQKLAGLQ